MKLGSNLNFLEPKKNDGMTYQNLWNKAMIVVFLRSEGKAINAYIKNQLVLKWTLYVPRWFLKNKSIQT